MGMGRPLRIRLTDCDVQLLGPTDLAAIMPGLGDKSIAILEHCNSVAPIFPEVVKLSVALGDVVECQFSVGNAGNVENVGRCETALIEWYHKVNQYLGIDLTGPAGDDAASPVLLYKYILNLYFQ